MRVALAGVIFVHCAGQLAPDARCESDLSRVCQGPNRCPVDTSCQCVATNDTELGYCADDSSPRGCLDAAEGEACIDLIDTCDFGANVNCWDAKPFELARLFGVNGAGARARYADFSDWTGDPLPQVDSCPVLASAQLCGPSCSPCPSNAYCHGRSPIHPFGVCLPSVFISCIGNSCADPAKRCFTYTVQPETQMLANGVGMCLPSAVCNDLAENLPGGASCN
jgi:hypothetical protein